MNILIFVITISKSRCFKIYQNGSSDLIAMEDSLKMIYDTKIVEDYWEGNYWKGKLESNILKIKKISILLIKKFKRY